MEQGEDVVNSGLPQESWLYRNWRAYLRGDPELMAEEVPIFSDARFSGELREQLGPYTVLNAIADPPEPGSLVPGLVLRAAVHLADNDIEAINKAFARGIPDTSAYTGDTNVEELCSLFSLAHGVRAAPGEPNRWFHPSATDSRGSPRHSSHPPPSLERRTRRLRIPDACRKVSLSAELLELYPRMAWSSARELARAARSYRRALWFAEADGNLSWLFLVASAETLANEWARASRLPALSPADLLKEMRPDFADRLQTAAGEHAKAVLTEVGQTLKETLRAQWKFTTFLLQYGLVPREPRPSGTPLDFSPQAMKDVLRVVYKYRSEALHSSKPFPPPMYEPPLDSEVQGALSEKPSGSGTYVAGGFWQEEDLPINLHAFHHLVRTAAHAWWKESGATSGGAA